MNINAAFRFGAISAAGFLGACASSPAPVSTNNAPDAPKDIVVGTALCPVVGDQQVDVTFPAQGWKATVWKPYPSAIYIAFNQKSGVQTSAQLVVDDQGHTTLKNASTGGADIWFTNPNDPNRIWLNEKINYGHTRVNGPYERRFLPPADTIRLMQIEAAAEVGNAALAHCLTASKPDSALSSATPQPKAGDIEVIGATAHHVCRANHNALQATLEFDYLDAKLNRYHLDLTYTMNSRSPWNADINIRELNSGAQLHGYGQVTSPAVAIINHASVLMSPNGGWVDTDMFYNKYAPTGFFEARAVLEQLNHGMNLPGWSNSLQAYFATECGTSFGGLSGVGKEVQGLLMGGRAIYQALTWLPPTPN